jgi:hypothetical protein
MKEQPAKKAHRQLGWEEVQLEKKQTPTGESYKYQVQVL